MLFVYPCHHTLIKTQECLWLLHSRWLMTILQPVCLISRFPLRPLRNSSSFTCVPLHPLYSAEPHCGAACLLFKIKTNEYKFIVLQINSLASKEQDLLVEMCCMLF
ncbi:hypothetical protein GOODEAATRI_032979 [Goodea atripinnis]|uniref:Uncharacterized protein n=1 Tax=Goodea atripinnis TaxID=208336 RepID=A0ABV0NQ26_9TELE